MKTAIHQAVLQFRIGMEGGGSAALVEFIDQFARASEQPDTHGRDLAAAMPVLQEVLSAQQLGDFLRVADLLEYELLPRIR